MGVVSKSRLLETHTTGRIVV